MSEQNKQESAVVVLSEGVSQLAPYGDKEVLNELVYRVMDFHPDVRAMAEEHGTDAAKQYALQIAQTAILMGASPLPGLNEIHAWREIKKKKVVQNGRDVWISYEVIRVGPGKNYWARRGVQVAGGIHWIIPARVMTKAERDEHGITDGDIGAICRGCRIDQLQERMTLVQAGILTREQLVEGTAVTGVGIASKAKDDRGNYKDQKVGRALFWTAEKRALADFYSKACPFIPGENVMPGEGLVRQADGRIGLDTSRLEFEKIDAPRNFRAISDTEAELLNSRWFGDADDYTEGEFTDDPDEPNFFDEPDEAAAPDEPDDVVIHSDGAGGTVEAGDEAAAPDEAAEDNKPTYSPAEMEILHARAKGFWTIALKNIPRYSDTTYLKAAAKLLGYKALDKDPHGRVIQFRMIHRYAAYRDAGMSKDDALAAMDAAPLEF